MRFVLYYCKSVFITALIYLDSSLRYLFRGLNPIIDSFPNRCYYWHSFFLVLSGHFCLNINSLSTNISDSFFFIFSMLLYLTYSQLDWLVGCFGFNGPLRQCFSLYRAVSQREGERGEKGQTRLKMSKQPPPAPTASTIGQCPTLFQISRTPRHWKFTQHHRTTRPSPSQLEIPHNT